MSYYKDTVHSKAPFRVRMAEFGCRHCGRRWSSANGSLEDYQKCKNCYTECYPVGSRIREPNKFGNENRQTLQSHKKELCGKCARLGRSCMMLDDDSDSDNDPNDIDMYIKTTPQTYQSNGREYHQDENQPVTESYSFKYWPELTTLGLRYLPAPYTPSNSSRIKLASTSNGVTSVGMTAADTLADAIDKARNKTVHESYGDSFLWEDLSEDKDEGSYQQGDNAANEIWDYETFILGNDNDTEDDELHYNNPLNRLDDDLGMSGDNIEELASSDDEVVALDNTNNAEHYFYQYLEDYSSSQDEEACFDGMDDMLSDDDFYKKQMDNRLLRRGRKHAFQGRKNSLKLLVD